VNTSSGAIEKQLSAILSSISQPARLQIIMVIAEQEACVCHLETALGLRQASISQHLMALRKIGLVRAHRVGRNMFYQLNKPEVINVVEQIARIYNLELEELRSSGRRPIPGCPCPQCNPELDPLLTCKNGNTQLSRQRK